MYGLRAPGVFLVMILMQRLFEHVAEGCRGQQDFGQNPLEFLVFFLEPFELRGFQGGAAAMPGLPPVKGGAAHSVFPAEFGYRNSFTMVLGQDAGDPILTEPALAHHRYPLGRSPAWRGFALHGQELETAGVLISPPGKPC
jgi:hypothetical protein